MRDITLLQPELEVLFRLAHGPGLAGDHKIARHQNGPGIADSVRLEVLDLLDDAQAQSPERDLGVDRSRALELLGLSASAGTAPRTGGRRRAVGLRSSFSPAAAAWPPKPISPSEHS